MENRISTQNNSTKTKSIQPTTTPIRHNLADSYIAIWREEPSCPNGVSFIMNCVINQVLVCKLFEN
ncbi:MAG: hypothetical protein QMA81_02610 [Candidatus Blochmannia vicinus]|nr:MAG: hypothetical protein QMA81_02610 [Candidatus Blochmannia vicinus]